MRGLADGYRRSQHSQEFVGEVLVLWKGPVHHVDLHDRMLIARAPRAMAHICLPSIRPATPRGFDEFRNKKGDRMGGAFLVLKPAGEIARDTPELGQAEDHFVRNVRHRDVVRLAGCDAREALLP